MAPQEVIHGDNSGAAELHYDTSVVTYRQLSSFEIANISFTNLTYSVFNTDGDEGILINISLSLNYITRELIL